MRLLFLKILFSLLVTLICFKSAFADTYPVVVKNNCNYSPSIVTYSASFTNAFNFSSVGECLALHQANPKGAGWTYTSTSNSVIGWAYGNNQGQTIIQFSNTCPYGGTVSGSSCINASACPSGQNRNTITGACQTPPTCSVGQTYDQGTNTCTTTICPTGQTFQATLTNPTGSCVAIPPNCDSTSTTAMLCSDTPVTCLSATGYMQSLSKPRCSPVFCTAPQIPNSTGDSCIQPPPLVCPTGFHSNATSTACDADAINACPAGSYSGSINGQHVCIPGTSPNPTNTNNPNPLQPSYNTATGTETWTTINPDGSKSTTSGTSTINLDTTGLSTEASLQAILGKFTQSSGKTPYVAPPAGVVPSDTNAAQIAALKTQLQTLITGIKADFSSLTPTLSGSGGVPSDTPITLSLFGVTANLGLNNYVSQLSTLGTLIVFVAAFLAFGIIFG